MKPHPRCVRPPAHAVSRNPNPRSCVHQHPTPTNAPAPPAQETSGVFVPFVLGSTAAGALLYSALFAYWRWWPNRQVRACARARACVGEGGGEEGGPSTEGPTARRGAPSVYDCVRRVGFSACACRRLLRTPQPCCLCHVISHWKRRAAPPARAHHNNAFCDIDVSLDTPRRAASTSAA